MKIVRKIRKLRKSFLLIILVLILLFIVISILLSYKQNPKIFQQQIKACSQDSDCVIVESDCCGCEMGGNSISINNKYQDEWISKKAKECNKVFCTAIYRCNGEAKCIKNICQISPLINQSTSISETRLGITTSRLKITKDQESRFKFGVKNIFNKNMNFSINIYSENSSKDAELWFEYPEIIIINPGDYNINEVKVNPINASQGSYIFTLTVCENEDETDLNCTKESNKIYAFGQLFIDVI